MAEIDITLQAANGTVGLKPTAGNNDEIAAQIAYQLKVDQMSHTFRDPGVPIELPTDSTSPTQLRTIVVSLGLRSEEIRLSGTLTDRGSVSASNPRKQTLLDIVRQQWLRISGVSGGLNASPDNPNSYALLTIGTGTDADGTSNRAYRVMITEMSFTIVGGQVDIFRWTMSCIVIMNEKPY